MKDFRFKVPQKHRIGVGSLKKLPEILKENNSEHVYLVSDHGLESIGVVKKVQDIVEAGGLTCTTFLDVVPNPTVDVVNASTKMYKGSGATSIIALGGGSSMDVAKATGRTCYNGGEINDYEGLYKVPGPIVPMIAIPTTAGTGSEVTASAVITDEAKNFKMSVISLRDSSKICKVLDPVTYHDSSGSYRSNMWCVMPLIHSQWKLMYLNFASPFSDGNGRKKQWNMIGGNLRRLLLANRKDEE